ncbi:hypothetical protein KJ766_00955, partial [Patescibacteria group bacterium]|nr:hypothetical protein [Patescibacteria group bacterium]
MLALRLLIGIIIPFLLGNAIIGVFDRKKILQSTENIATSFLIGLGAVTLLSFLSFWIALPYQIYLIGAFSILLFIFKIIFIDRGVQFNKPQSVKLNIKTILIILLLVLIAIKLSYVFVEALSKPEYAWDACANWSLWGKRIFY